MAPRQRRTWPPPTRRAVSRSGSASGTRTCTARRSCGSRSSSRSSATPSRRWKTRTSRRSIPARHGASGSRSAAPCSPGAPSSSIFTLARPRPRVTPRRSSWVRTSTASSPILPFTSSSASRCTGPRAWSPKWPGSGATPTIRRWCGPASSSSLPTPGLRSSRRSALCSPCSSSSSTGSSRPGSARCSAGTTSVARFGLAQRCSSPTSTKRRSRCWMSPSSKTASLLKHIAQSLSFLPPFLWRSLYSSSCPRTSTFRSPSTTPTLSSPSFWVPRGKPNSPSLAPRRLSPSL
mmetsp:Transcript_11616/g.29476  ORF Transcript_11616/g.29476 Transcript_11616/m.29476 type:complete len:291 (-) Transcript_11616:155-1027(-)